MDDKQEPIAIVGMSCRFGGDADTPKGLWNMLAKGETAWSKIPASRWNADSYYHPSAEREGSVTTDSGFFLKEDLSKFDAAFFSMTAAEAAAFENAGMTIQDVAGSSTSCYVGAYSADYTVTSTSNLYDTNPYAATGLGRAMLSNRVSWFFDLRGASVTLDTACSSALVAGEEKMALVGASNLFWQLEIMRGLSSLHFLSPDGKCHSFDEAANGYGRGEGLGFLVLKSLKDALRDNDTIRAVIRGSGLNQDGKTPAITMPSKEAQIELIRTAYTNAGIDLQDTQYFEAHGTGTAIGDPIELGGIGESMGVGRTKENAVVVGSVKTNLGHLESAAGMAGIIKAVLAMEHGVIPEIVGLKTLNPKLKLDEWGLKLNTKLIPWPGSATGIRRASVNSFGYGGANAHAIVDDAKHYLESHNLQGNHSSQNAAIPNSSLSSVASAEEKDTVTSTTPNLLIFSSPEQSGVTRLGEAYAVHFGEVFNNSLEFDMNNLAYTLGERRTLFDWRNFSVAGSLGEFTESLKQGLPKPRRAVRSPGCAYVFTGQGAQYATMGRELLANSVFRQSLEQADKYLASLGSNWSVLEEISKADGDSRINDPEISQPLCTILQVALVTLLEYWGVSPKSVIGHSSGEIVAYFRGLYSGALPTSHPELAGAMMAVALSEEAASKYTSKCATGTIVVACINSPSSVTLSGDLTAIKEAETLLRADDIWCRKLKVKTAYHSPHMSFIQDKYLTSIQKVAPMSGNEAVDMFSSVTGRKILPTELGPEYWVKNMLSPVRFSEGVKSLLLPAVSRGRRQKAAGVQLLIEIGPHGVLKSPITQILAANSKPSGETTSYIAVLHRGKNAYSTALEAAGCLWTYGHRIRLNLVNSSGLMPKAHKVLSDLPSYPWNHERNFWHESRQNAFKRLHQKPRTDLLGYPEHTFNPLNAEQRWTNFLKPFEIPWVMDHVIQGLVVLPGGASMAMAIEACHQIADKSKNIDGFEFRDVNFTRALMFGAPDDAIEVSMVWRLEYLGTRTSEHAWHKFIFSSVSKDNITTEHSNGLIRIRYSSLPNEVENSDEAELKSDEYLETYQKISASSNMEVDINEMYKEIAGKGMQFGPMFSLMKSMRGGQDLEDGKLIGVASLEIPDTAATMPEGFEYPLLIHPAVFDAVFQVAYSRISCGGTTDNVTVISSVESLYVSASIPNKPGTILTGYNKSWQSGRAIWANIVISDESFSKPLVVASGVRNAILAADHGKKESKQNTQHLTRLEWKVDPRNLSQQSLTIFSDEGSNLDSTLLAWFNLIADQNTNLHILEIGTSSTPIAPSILEVLGGNNGTGPRTFNIIMINDANSDFPIIKFTVEKIRRLLNPGGHLVIASFAQKSVPWLHNLESCGLLCWHSSTHTSIGAETHPAMIIASSLPKLEVSEGQQVVIVETNDIPSTTKRFSSNVASQLTRLGHNVTESSLDSMSDPKGKVLISLLDLGKSSLLDLSKEEFATLKNMILDSSGVLWVTRGGIKNGPSVAEHSIASGLFRTIRSEAPHLRLFNLDLSLTSDAKSEELSKLMVNVFTSSFCDDDSSIMEHEYAEDNGVVYIPRLVQDSSMNASFSDTSLRQYQMRPLFQPGRPLKLAIGEVGILDTLIFVDREEFEQDLPPWGVEIEILFSALNFVDVMGSLGYISDDALGAEFSGRITRVGSEVPKDKPVPENIAPEVAAACHIVFVTAYFAFHENGRLKAGDTVLIHSAAGGVGQAAIQLAQKLGAIIYCTVGSTEKKSLLMEKYSIPENRIFSSRDISFAQGIMRETKDRGVDMILNSTFGEVLRVTWNCLADFGVMVEVGKRDILLNNSLEMGPFIRGCTFTAVNLAQYTTADCEPRQLKFYLEVLQKINGMLAKGEIKSPFPLHVMDVTQAEEAFQLLKSGKMAGKLVLKTSPNSVVRTKPRKEKVVQLDPESTYLLAGGLGAWCETFFSRSGAQSLGSKNFLEKLRGLGVDATSYVCDIADMNSVKETLCKVSKDMPPIKGFVHCAMQLKDAVFENMTYEDWRAATAPKIAGSWNLHALLPANLDFFIMLSSASGIVGNPGQANYAAGNTYQNGLAHFRRRQGLAATSIDLSAVSGIGYLAENASSYENQNILKIAEKNMSISEEEIHHVFLAAVKGIVQGGIEVPAQITTGIMGADGQSGSDGKEKNDSDLLVETIVGAQSMVEAAAIVEAALVRRLAKSLGMAEVDVNVEKPLHAYGVDSLIAVEVRNWVVKELKADISILDILSPMAITTLAAKISDGSRLIGAYLRTRNDSQNLEGV
ncbi:hypothetical protein DL98DRAFT_535488 [Cadophora sp. DSE1049]|nr:hypothetical protein DL98DRAFT_535488 [Cadophora sp. DSE1049]